MSIDLAFMDKIIDFHEAEYASLATLSVQLSLDVSSLCCRRSMDIIVQPAVSWMDLNNQIKDSGLFFPVDPGPSVRSQPF